MIAINSAQISYLDIREIIRDIMSFSSTVYKRGSNAYTLKQQQQKENKMVE